MNLSDDAEKELPEELQDKIREQPGEIEEETLKEWVEKEAIITEISIGIKAKTTAIIEIDISTIRFTIL